MVDRWDVREGDCRDVLAGMDAASIDAIVTDPPYNLGFMGHAFDSIGRPAEFQAWCQSWAVQCCRVLKPGGYLVAFGGTRTFHRLACGIEDAGFEMRDTIGNLGLLGWIHGEGFPKSHDFAAVPAPKPKPPNWTRKVRPEFVGTPFAEGWGTTLKPAWEPILIARSPFVGSVGTNVNEHGTGAINVDGCRVVPGSDLGRWPANVTLDEHAASALDDQTRHLHGAGFAQGPQTKWGYEVGNYPIYGTGKIGAVGARVGDSGGAARFFYCAKADVREREAGLDALPARFAATMKDGIGSREHSPEDPRSYRRNIHPTIKPVSLMRWLCRLVCPPHGLILDPFTGSGTTGIAALLEGFRFLGIELDPERAGYLTIARARLSHVAQWGDLWLDKRSGLYSGSLF